MKPFNIFLRVTIFLTVVLITFVFFKPDSFNQEKNKSVILSNLDNQYDIYFINPNKDSVYITGKFLKKNNSIVVEGKIKSLAKNRLKTIEIEFIYYSENNLILGKETLTISKELIPKSIVDFLKEGLTIPEETKEIRVLVKSSPEAYLPKYKDYMQAK